MVTKAVRKLHSADAADVAALGLLEGFQEGEVAGILHAVGDEHVLWSSRCTCFVNSQPRGVPILCGPCATYRANVARAAALAASKEYNPRAPNCSLYTPAKVNNAVFEVEFLIFMCSLCGRGSKRLLGLFRETQAKVVNVLLEPMPVSTTPDNCKWNFRVSVFEFDRAILAAYHSIPFRRLAPAGA